MVSILRFYIDRKMESICDCKVKIYCLFGQVNAVFYMFAWYWNLPSVQQATPDCAGMHIHVSIFLIWYLRMDKTFKGRSLLIVDNK